MNKYHVTLIKNELLAPGAYLHTYENEEGSTRLGFLLELHPGIRDAFDHVRLLNAIIDHIRGQSPDFTQGVKMQGREDIALTIFEHGTGPNFQPGLKKRYIFRERELV